MITDPNHRRVYSALNRNELADYWNGYFQYERDAPTLHAIAERELEREIQECKNAPTPYVDSKVVISNILGRLSSRHNFHRQFIEQFPGLQREQILGMQLYTIMLRDPETWVYVETHHAGHMFPNATYFIANRGD